MGWRGSMVLVLVLVLVGMAGTSWAGEWGTGLPGEVEEPVVLPAVEMRGGGALRGTLVGRRSVREFSEAGLTLGQVSQLLWAAQGVTNDEGYRTAPSAGARFPLELYVVVERVEGLEAGLYHYRVGEHSLGLVRGDARAEVLREACLGQPSVGAAPVSVIVVAVVQRVADKYGEERSERYVVTEAGAAMQNLMLEAVGLGLGTVAIGGFEDGPVQAFVGTDAMPVVVVPVGVPAE